MDDTFTNNPCSHRDVPACILIHLLDPFYSKSFLIKKAKGLKTLVGGNSNVCIEIEDQELASSNLKSLQYNVFKAIMSSLLKRTKKPFSTYLL
jgi:hypothetical protein